MKRILAALILISFILSFTGCSGVKETDEGIDEADTFEIYLAGTESVRQYGFYDYENLTLEGAPVLTGNDVRKYYWDSHIMELNGTFVEKVYGSGSGDYDEYVIDSEGFRSYSKGGSRLLGSSQYMAFVIVVNGEKIISGTFPGSPVMPVEGEMLVLGDIADDRIQLKFNGEGFDIRNKDAVYDYFDGVQKISELPAVDSDSVTDELKAQLEASNERYIELEERYNALLSGLSDVPSNEQRLQALADWQEARLNLYMIETQEGSQFELFCSRLSELDLSEISSLGTATEYYRQMAGADFYVNDRMFNVLEEFYNTVIAGIPYKYSMGDIDDDFIRQARAFGVNISITNGYIEATLQPSYLKANFELFVSEILNEYLLLKDRELSLILDTEMMTAADDENLYLDIEQVADLVYEWKKFSDTYTNAYPFNIKARLKAEEYLAIYIGKRDFATSPVYEQATQILTSEAKASYIRFLGEYRDSAYYSLIADLFIVLEGSGFRRDTDVTNFIESTDFSEYGY